MNIYFYLWLAMTICTVILVYINRQKADQYKAVINDLEKDWNEMAGHVDDYKKLYEKLRKENEVLRKQAADYIPMKSLTDYKEKVLLLTEQAEDMFGFYIDKVTMTRYSNEFGHLWKIDMETEMQKKPKDNIEKR